jgi:hypothetical protein
MAECRGPSVKDYTLDSATQCMQLMKLVLSNRLKNHPQQFGARGATALIDIIKAPKQFQGFENYPNYSAEIVARLQSMLDIANNEKNQRHGDFADFINAAV